MDKWIKAIAFGFCMRLYVCVYRFLEDIFVQSDTQYRNTTLNTNKAVDKNIQKNICGQSASSSINTKIYKVKDCFSYESVKKCWGDLGCSLIWITLLAPWMCLPVLVLSDPPLIEYNSLLERSNLLEFHSGRPKSLSLYIMCHLGVREVSESKGIGPLGDV